VIDRILANGPVASNYEIHEFDAKRRRAWQHRELERVRLAALALVSTHRPIDTNDGRIVAGFDGAALWTLMGALDRTEGGES
jgi:hypothetical protein